MSHITVGSGILNAPKIGDPCANCKARPSVSWWCDDEGPQAMIRGYARPWCERCCIVAQIAHQRAMAAKLPETEARLAAIDADEAAGVPWSSRYMDAQGYREEGLPVPEHLK